MKQTIIDLRIGCEEYTIFIDDVISKFPHLPLRKLINSFGNGVSMVGRTTNEADFNPFCTYDE